MLEHRIFANLIHNEEYARKVIPFIKSEYFEDAVDRVIFEQISSYVGKYNSFPSIEALTIDLGNVPNITDDMHQKCQDIVKTLDADVNTDQQWLIDNTEKFCKDMALKGAILKSIEVMNDDKTGNLSRGAIPQLLQDALGVSFDTHIGHDFLEDAESRYDYYHQKENKLPFDLEMFNKITRGGLSRKTITVILAGVGVGKSLCMCHMAQANLLAGRNVLYITLELSEQQVSERIDANVLDVPINELEYLDKDIYFKRLGLIRNKTTGKLIVKEFPAASVGAAHFRHVLNELKIKKNFVPDVIYIDYINLCVSSRLSYKGNHNSYTIVKAIAEELRGLATEFDLPIVTATQLNREGFKSSDVGMEDTAESFGLPATADIMVAITQSETLASLNQYMVKQLKNRKNDINYLKRFVIGVDKPKMRLYDVEQEAQDDILDGPNQDKPVMDNSSVGQRITDEFKKSKFTDKFKDFT